VPAVNVPEVPVQSLIVLFGLFFKVLYIETSASI
jgi:hypothetical protein